MILSNVRVKTLISWVALARVISWCRESFRFSVKVTLSTLIPSFMGMVTNRSRVLKPYLNVDSLLKVIWTHLRD